MKIAILNECFFEDSHIKRLEKLGEVVVHPNTVTEEDVIKRLGDVDIGIIDMFVADITESALSKCEKLKLLALNTTGFDALNHAHARSLNIDVTNVPNFSTDAVAEQSIAMMIAVNRKIVIGDSEFRDSIFEIDPGNKKHRRYLGSNFKARTLGVVGCGNVGSQVLRLAMGLGMKVLAYNRTKKTIPGVKFVSLKELLQQSDIISINVALDSETENLIGEEEFKLMKPETILINTARGGIVNTEALYKALKNHTIAGAGVDTVTITKNHLLLKLDNIIFSPHSAWYTKESLQNIAEIITSTVESYVNGKKINVIN